MTFPTTYATWLDYIRDWLAADEFEDSQIASFLDLAQLRLNREMMSYGMEASYIYALTGATPFTILSVVTDFSKIRLVSFEDIGALDVLAINEMKTKLELAEDTGDPEAFCIDAGKLYLYPEQSAGNVELFYYKKIPYLATSTQETNVFSTDYPDALLYAALLAAAPYTKENEDIPVWENQYAIALATANNASNDIKRGSVPLKRSLPR